MSKTKTLFTVALLVLLGSMGAAQAQNLLYEVKVFTTPAAGARAGGEDEMSGGILLNFTPNPSNDLTVTLDYSVPLAGDIDSGSVGADSEGLTTSLTTTVAGSAENDDNDGNGTITITTIGNGENLLIRGVMLDVSDASGTVTVTVKVVSSDITDFIRIDGPSSATVIEDILVGVTATPDLKIVRTRGTGMEGITASLTLKESFKGAFMMGNMLEIESSGIPEGASLAAAVTNNPPDDPDDTPDAFPTSSYAVVEGVKAGVVTVRLGGMDNEETPNLMRGAPEKVELALTLTAEPDDEDISFPLDVGSIMAKVTFTGDGDDDGGSFTDAFTDYVTVFNIRPAQCELLFPVVTVIPATTEMNMWETAISVTNPAYGEEMASGGLTLTFYPMGAEPVVYETEMGSPGSGLDADGTLAPGGTYQVLISQILGSTDWGDSFQGHVHLLADYTHCTGVGWVTDWVGVNQAYSAVVISADTGTDE